MIARLNLASQPFRNRTLPWATAAVVAVGSLLLLVYALSEGQRARTQGDAAERSVLQMRGERSAIEAQAREVRQSVPPDQMEVLDAAHALADRKAFSWSQLFADLEAAMPSQVRLQRISVSDVAQRGGETRAVLEMTVVSRTYESVTAMMSEMSRLGSFTATPLNETYKSDRGESGYVWTLRVSYVQRARAGGEAAEGASVASASETARAEVRD